MKLNISLKNKGIAFDEDIKALYTDTIGGQIGILAGHIPMITALKQQCKIKIINNNNEEMQYSIKNGFLEIMADHNINIIADEISK